MGVILPREFVDRRHLHEDETVIIQVFKKGSRRDLFGSLKGVKISGQEFKDMVREGWD